MNKALEGNQTEVIITKLLNQKECSYWNELPYDKDTSYAIHIKNKKFATLNNEKIQPKADVFFATGFVNKDYLIKNEYYLNEDDVINLNLKSIDQSGLSIKMNNSNFTIIKISPNTFVKIFNDNVIGAGASIYSTKDFDKNINVIKGWGIEESYFKQYYCKCLDIIDFELDDKIILGKIKTFANKQIESIILADFKICDLVFKGIGNFEEPYTAHWLLENNLIKKNYYIPFNVTTGSGRSKNIYTIVLKPKNV
jgi:hypothetical protein